MGTLRDRNRQIETMFDAEIARRGLSGKLEVEPIDNTFTRRPRFFTSKSDGLPHFKVLMWTLNKLDDESLQREISRHIDAAQDYFEL